MCNCCHTNHATLWSVTPVNARNGCGYCSTQTASTMPVNTYGGFGCCCGCAAQTQNAYRVQQVNGCSSCPYAQSGRCGCRTGCASTWCANN